MRKPARAQGVITTKIRLRAACKMPASNTSTDGVMSKRLSGSSKKSRQNKRRLIVCETWRKSNRLLKSVRTTRKAMSDATFGKKHNQRELNDLESNGFQRHPSRLRR